MDFVKPGRHTFCVQNDTGEVKEEAHKKGAVDRALTFVQGQVTAGAVAKETFYAHEYLADFRAEPVPHSFKERHMRSVKEYTHKPKEVFKDWVADSGETLKLCIEQDFPHIDFEKLALNEDIDGAKRLESVLAINYQFLKSTYHLLQSQSRRYPYVDNATMRNKFILELDVMDSQRFSMAKFETLLNQYTRAEVAGKRIPVGCLSRAGFLNLVVHFARFYYSSSEGLLKAEQVDAEYGSVSVAKAVEMLVERKLIPFH